MRIETIIKTVPVGILVLAPEGSVELFNKSFEETYTRIMDEKVPLELNINDTTDNTFFNSIENSMACEKLIPEIIEPAKGYYLQIISKKLSFDVNEPLGTLIEFHDVTPFFEWFIPVSCLLLQAIESALSGGEPFPPI